MRLNNIIFHKLITEQHKAPVLLEPRSASVDLPNSKAESLVDAALANYQKESSLAYAGFLLDSHFPSSLNKFLTGEIDFYNFSISILNNLRQEMMRVPASTGGYLTIAHYFEEEKEILLLLLLKDKIGIGITSDLELEDVHSLNLDKLHVAATINISDWKAGKEKYISFLKGKARDKEVVGYFKSFVCIDEDMYTDPVKHTRDLVNAIKNYCKDKLQDSAASDAKARVHSYSMIKAEKEQSITLDEIANLLSPSSPEDFIAYLREKKLEIPGEFQPVAARLNNLVKYRVKGETTDYTLSFEHSAIEDNKIWLNSDEYLVISDVPAWIKRQLPCR